MTDIAGLLGAEAESLLEHRCQGIPAEKLSPSGAKMG